jgi:hypothetical protein
MTPQVYIPSRGRWDGSNKLARTWLKEGFDVNWILEAAEHEPYLESMIGISLDDGNAFRAGHIHIHPLPKPNMGVGFARNHALNVAASYGCKSIILADDDIKPGKQANMFLLTEEALHPKVLGITARYSYHDLCLGPDIRGRNDLVLLSTGTFRLVGLNVNNVLDIGNYDHTLIGLEDNDLFLRGLEAGYPWLIHLGTYANSIGTRYQPGGMSDFMEDHGISKEDVPPWYKDLADQYPDFVSGADTKRIRFKWKQAYDHYLPGWRKWSALDGGDLARYLGE